jgi:hypothetical protein
VEVKEETFRIRTYECGVDGRVKIFSLMQYLQEIAALHAEQLGLGFDKLSEMGGYWVLSNIRNLAQRLQPDNSYERVCRQRPKRRRAVSYRQRMDGYKQKYKPAEEPIPS